MLLRPGCYDRGAQCDPQRYVNAFHDWNLPRKGFRGEENGKWVSFKEIAGANVETLQKQLHDLGFYAKGRIDGIYGYRTLSAVRLFQEYVRAVEGRADIGNVDGLAGDGTKGHVRRWIDNRIRPDLTGSKAKYDEAIAGLRKLHAGFKSSGLRGIELVNEHAEGTSTRRVDDWTYGEDEIHLVGIRRNENEVLDATTSRGAKVRVRRNDDIIVLLVNGMRLAFRGSTNPSPNMAKRADQAFLLRGQHEYRFGWHKVAGTQSNPDKTKVYRAFKPKAPAGPLIVRAVGDLLTDESFRRPQPNPAINIHWSGAGAANWSAGCQVVAGLKYIDFRDEIVDLSGRAARGYADLSGRKTRGAYNVLVDVMTIFADDIRTTGSTVLYTLLYERDVKATAAAAGIDFRSLVARLQ